MLVCSADTIYDIRSDARRPYTAHAHQFFPRSTSIKHDFGICRKSLNTLPSSVRHRVDTINCEGSTAILHERNV